MLLFGFPRKLVGSDSTLKPETLGKMVKYMKGADLATLKPEPSHKIAPSSACIPILS